MIATKEGVNPEPGAYYVSVIDGARYGLLLGPFVWHAAALAWVARVRQAAYDVDPRSHWYAFGTCGLHPGTPAPVGRLNELLGITAEQMAERGEA
jgi:hypothetical protein